MAAFLLIAAVAEPAPAAAEVPVIAAPADCAPAVAADPEAAREAAARWFRLGGGTPARLCEAAALAALGAHATAATLLTRLAENPGRALSAPARATILADAAHLWLDADQPALARETVAAAGRLAPLGAPTLVVAARAAAALGAWDEARAALDAALETEPDQPLVRALRAAALRHTGDAGGALAEARAARAAAPDLPEARFEEAAALAELGRGADAATAFLDFAADHPGHALAEAARANAIRLAGD